MGFKIIFVCVFILLSFEVISANWDVLYTPPFQDNGEITLNGTTGLSHVDKMVLHGGWSPSPFLLGADYTGLYLNETDKDNGGLVYYMGGVDNSSNVFNITNVNIINITWFIFNDGASYDSAWRVYNRNNMQVELRYTTPNFKFFNSSGDLVLTITNTTNGWHRVFFYKNTTDIISGVESNSTFINQKILNFTLFEFAFMSDGATRIDNLTVTNGTSFSIIPSTLNLSITEPLSLVTLRNNTNNKIAFNITINASFNFNVSLFLNGSANILNNSFLDNLAGQSIFMQFNETIPDGWHSYWFSVSMNGNNIAKNTSNTSFLVSSDIPSIIYYNPLNNVSLFNLTTNITISDNDLHSYNFSVFYPNKTLFYNSSQFISGNRSFSIVTVVNFTQELNYTIQTLVTDLSSNMVALNQSYFYDNSAPTITISQPTGIVGGFTSTLLTTVADKSSLSNCWYKVTDSNLNQHIAPTSYNCISDSFTVSTNGNFIVFVNATDSKNVNNSNVNSSFTVNTAGSGGSSGGGGGGGGATGEEKPLCDKIKITPIDISVSTSNRLTEVKIENKESSSFDPTFKFTTTDKKDYSKELIVTNAPNTILKDATASFGVKYDGTSTDSGENKLILSSDNCKDIELNIFVNSGITKQLISSFLDPNKTFLENMKDLLLAPLVNKEPFTFLKNWMIFILFNILLFVFTIRWIIKQAKLHNRARAFFLPVLNVFTSLFITIIINVIVQNLGG